GGTDESGQTVTLTATSSNPALIPNPTITGSGSTRTLTYQPAANANGTVTITVTANDGQSTNNTFNRTFTITVTEVNDPPTAFNRTASTNEDTALRIPSSLLTGGSIIAQSTFDTGDGGWRVGDFFGTTGSSVPTYVASGGNPGGFIRTPDLFGWNS